MTRVYYRLEFSCQDDEIFPVYLEIKKLDFLQILLRGMVLRYGLDLP